MTTKCPRCGGAVEAAGAAAIDGVELPVFACERCEIRAAPSGEPTLSPLDLHPESLGECLPTGRQGTGKPAPSGWRSSWPARAAAGNAEPSSARWQSGHAGIDAARRAPPPPADRTSAVTGPPPAAAQAGGRRAWRCSVAGPPPDGRRFPIRSECPNRYALLRPSSLRTSTRGAAGSMPKRPAICATSSSASGPGPGARHRCGRPSAARSMPQAHASTTVYIQALRWNAPTLAWTLRNCC